MRFGEPGVAGDDRLELPRGLGVAPEREEGPGAAEAGEIVGPSPKPRVELGELPERLVDPAAREVEIGIGAELQRRIVVGAGERKTLVILANLSPRRERHEGGRTRSEEPREVGRGGGRLAESERSQAPLEKQASKGGCKGGGSGEIDLPARGIPVRRRNLARSTSRSAAPGLAAIRASSAWISAFKPSWASTEGAARSSAKAKTMGRTRPRAYARKATS